VFEFHCQEIVPVKQPVIYSSSFGPGVRMAAQPFDDEVPDGTYDFPIILIIGTYFGTSGLSGAPDRSFSTEKGALDYLFAEARK
jgi:hypothetical protein